MGLGLSRVSEKILPYLSYPGKTVINSELSAKIGYGDRRAYAAEFSLNYLENHSKYFSQGDAQKLGFNVSLLKAYDFGIYVNPFLKVGFGAGMFKTDADTNNNSLTYGNFHLGGGFFIPLSKQMDIEVAYQYRFVSYEKIDLTSSTNPKSHINAVYTGLNIRF
jgi:opacity protein-like surface antigen